MAFSVVNLMGTIENLLTKNNTNTAGSGGSLDISDGLNNRVVSFYKGVQGLHEVLPVPKTLYPAVFIEMGPKGEDFGQLGNNAKRKMVMNVDIVPVTHLETTSVQGESRENANLEIITLSQNIEELIRNKVRLSTSSGKSNLILNAKVLNSNYSVNLGQEQTYNNVSIISLEIEALST